MAEILTGNDEVEGEFGSSLSRTGTKVGAAELHVGCVNEGRMI
jgi:hypothetical protein